MPKKKPHTPHTPTKKKPAANGAAPEPNGTSVDTAAALVQSARAAIREMLAAQPVQHGQALIHTLVERGHRRATIKEALAALKAEGVTVETGTRLDFKVELVDDTTGHVDTTGDVQSDENAAADGPEDADDADDAADDLSDLDASSIEEELEPKAHGSNGTYEYRPTRYLMHIFTADEINAFRADREEKDRVIDELDRELETHQEKVRGLKKRIDELTDEGRALSRKVRDGSEYRNVACDERREPDPRPESPTHGQLMMVTRRIDTMEIVEVRELRGIERQGILFDEAPAKTPASGNVTREPSTVA